MKINSEVFLNIYYALMGENEIESTYLYNIVEVVKAIYSSHETAELAKSLDIEDLNLEAIIKHQFTKEVTDDEVIKFEISDDEIDQILDKYSEYSDQFAKAINKSIYASFIEKESDGKIKLSYDDSDGEYEIISGDSPIDNKETKVFTDGDIEDNGVTSDEQFLAKKRKMTISNSTYTIVVDYSGGQPLLADTRVMSSEMIPIAIEEAKSLIRGVDISHNVFLDKIPKIYKRKIH